jgi:hypothetical protein
MYLAAALTGGTSRTLAVKPLGREARKRHWECILGRIYHVKPAECQRQIQVPLQLGVHVSRVHQVRPGRGIAVQLLVDASSEHLILLEKELRFRLGLEEGKVSVRNRARWLLSLLPLFPFFPFLHLYLLHLQPKGKLVVGKREVSCPGIPIRPHSVIFRE